MATISRVFATIAGGYAATVGMVAFASVLLTLCFGMQRSEAMTLMTMIGFIGYAIVVVWGFSEKRLARLWVVLVAVAIGSHLAAIGLADWLPPATNGG